MKALVSRRLGILAFGAIVTIAGSLVMAACSSDDNVPVTVKDGGGDSTTGDSSAGTGSVKLNVSYNQSARGYVGCVLATETGNPVAEGDDTSGNPTWPGTNPVTILNVAAGTYAAICYLDIGGNNQQGPGPEDPQSSQDNPPVVTVVAGQQASVDVPLFPPSGDGGTDGGADADASH